MKKLLTLTLALLTLAACTQERTKPLDIIPMPLSTQLQSSNFEFDKESKLAIEATEATVNNLTSYLATTSLSLKADNNAQDNRLALKIREKVDGISSPEGYVMTTDAKGINIEATTEAGLFYGVQTVLQFVDNEGGVPYGRIVDEPRFAYRGMMLDVSRHFFDKDFVLKQI